MNLKYFILEDEELELNIKKAEASIEEMKQREEEKAEKQWESDILSGLHLNHTSSASSGKSSQKTPGSNKSGPGKDKTPAGKSNISGSSFGSSIKNKKSSQPVAGKSVGSFGKK